MGMSAAEQRILTEIEQTLRTQDLDFARRIDVMNAAHARAATGRRARAGLARKAAVLVVAAIAAGMLVAVVVLAVRHLAGSSRGRCGPRPSRPCRGSSPGGASSRGPRAASGPTVAASPVTTRS